MSDVLREYPDVMTVPEVAEVFRVTGRQVTRLAREKALPAFKWGLQWRFLRAEIEAHITCAPPVRGPLLEGWPDVLTPAEVAELTRSTVRQVNEMADSIAGFRVGAEWRFLRARIISLLEQGRATSG